MPKRLYIEKRALSDSRSLSWDLAQHLSVRCEQSTTIIADRPAILLASVSKQWRKIIRQIQRARSGTLNAALIYELTQHLTAAQRLQMTTEAFKAANSASVHFLTLDQTLAQPPTCQTLYCTVTITEEDLQKITASLPAGALVVVFG